MVNAAIICGYLAGELNPEDEQKLERWVQMDQANESILSDFKKIWELSQISEESFSNSFDARDGWLMLRNNLSKKDSFQKKNDSDIENFPSGVRDFLVNE